MGNWLEILNFGSVRHYLLAYHTAFFEVLLTKSLMITAFERLFYLIKLNKYWMRLVFWVWIWIGWLSQWEVFLTPNEKVLLKQAYWKDQIEKRENQSFLKMTLYFVFRLNWIYEFSPRPLTKSRLSLTSSRKLHQRTRFFMFFFLKIK